MKSTIKKNMYLFIFIFILFYSCSKTTSDISTAPGSSVLLHKYGLNAMTDDQWSHIPSFSPGIFNPRTAEFGLTFSGTSLPSSYLLTTPAVRDQGQIGSCTGFCGTETDEILYYYNNLKPTSPVLTVANGIVTAVNTKFASPTTYFGSLGELSPLYLYYVERCVINKQSIKSDNGANMVNIDEALQGLSNNTGTGVPLTLNGQTYKGICTENVYPYPSSVISASNPYNTASSSSTLYKTAPGSNAISNSANYGITSQSGSVSSTGQTTIHGYYIINSTGDSTEVANVKIAILNNKPVMMGFNVYDNTTTYTCFEGLNSKSYIYNPLVASTTTKTVNGVTTSTTSYVVNPKLTLLGGHAVPLIGFVNDGTSSSSATGGGYFIVQNSWGTPWGYYGDFYLPYSVLKSNSIVPNGSLYVAIL